MPAILRASFIVVLLVTAAVVSQSPTATEANGAAGVSAGGAHACAVTTGGGVKCWGYNNTGQLGSGTTTNNNTPVDVVDLSAVSEVSAGGDHTCALTEAGGVACWGNNFDGQLGNGTFDGSSTPVYVGGLAASVSAVRAGNNHTCALTVVGGVKCWGSNAYGQRGNDIPVDSSTPVDVGGLTSGVSAVSTGGSHTCALTVAGGVKCWGANGYGQLGVGTTTTSGMPLDVIGLTFGVSGISAGSNHTCAVMQAGGVKCWGLNFSGQLGDGNDGALVIDGIPVDVIGLPPAVSAVSAGGSHTCALTATGGLKCWGQNSNGQLGNGTPTNSSTPVDVTGLAAGTNAVSAGGEHTCALIATGGGLKCWGNGQYGKLGIGMTIFASGTPISVIGKGPIDTDGDGCPDAKEGQITGQSYLTGGLRNYINPWDYFNPTHDGQNNIDDILLVVEAYFKDDNDGNPGLPPYAPGYDPGTDRTFVGPLAWNLGPPDGLQRVDDILNSVKQYFHDCS